MAAASASARAGGGSGSIIGALLKAGGGMALIIIAGAHRHGIAARLSAQHQRRGVYVAARLFAASGINKRGAASTHAAHVASSGIIINVARRIGSVSGISEEITAS